MVLDYQALACLDTAKRCKQLYGRVGCQPGAGSTPQDTKLPSTATLLTTDVEPEHGG